MSLRNMCLKSHDSYKLVDTYLPLAVSLSVMQLVHHCLISPKRFPFFLRNIDIFFPIVFYSTSVLFCMFFRGFFLYLLVFKFSAFDLIGPP